MRVLIVDNSKRWMEAVRRLLAEEFPEVEVTEYDPDQQGKPPPSFDWSLYDVALIGDDLDPAGSGVDWIREFGSARGFPPTILMTAEADLGFASRAVRVGAHSVVSKRGLTAQGLSESVSEALDSRNPSRPEGESADEATVRDARLFQEHFRAAQDPMPTEGYRFRRLIGQGAMSRVYLSERIDDGVTLVLKLLDGNLARSPDIIKRFVQEAAIVSALNSSHVVRIYEHGFTNRYGFIAMEFFSRGDLKQRLERGISVKAALMHTLNIAHGLRVIHNAGIIHRDLKPANVMFRADESLALADFGISKNVDATTELTVVGDVIGTPHYMSPEQARSQGVDARSDLYSAGVMLYEMLTGKKPYAGDSVGAIVYKHLHGEIPRLPPELSRVQPVIDRLLAKRPEERFQSADELIAALHALRRAA